MYQNEARQCLEGDGGLFAHAIALVDAAGLKGLSLRTLAQKAGISPSLLTYRYGGREGVIRKTFDEACRLDRDNWARREAAFGGVGSRPEDLPSIALGVAMDMISRDRQATHLFWIFTAAVQRLPDLKSDAPAWGGLMPDFWFNCLERTGLDTRLSAPFAAGVNAAARIGLLARDNPMLLPWMVDVLQRLCQRLLGQPLLSPGDSAVRRAVEAAGFAGRGLDPASRTETPERIVESAAGIIATQGPDALTHRRIARESGISLSSMTHHFASLDEIMLLAFQRIYDEARRESVGAIPSGHSVESLSRIVLPDIFARARRRAANVAAMDEMILATVRKPETAPLAGALMATFGQTSAGLLDAIENKPFETDRLDGQVFRFVMSGLTELVPPALQDEDRDQWIAQNCEVFLKAYLHGTS